MKFAIPLLLVVASVTARAAPAEPDPVAVQDDTPVPTSRSRPFRIYGSPSFGSPGDSFDADELPESEILGWRSVYDRPVFLALQTTDKPEIEAYLAENGVSGLVSSSNLRFLHDLLLAGEEKVGVMLSDRKMRTAPMAVTGISLPQGLAPSTAEHLDAIPWLLITREKDVEPARLRQLTLVGDFVVTEKAVTVASEVMPFSPRLATRFAAHSLGIPAFPTLSAKYKVDLEYTPLRSEMATPDVGSYKGLFTGSSSASPSESPAAPEAQDADADVTSPEITHAAAVVDAIRTASAIAAADAAAATENYE